MGEISVYDKIVVENQKEKIWNQQNFLHKFLSKRWCRNGIHN